MESGGAYITLTHPLSIASNIAAKSVNNCLNGIPSVIKMLFCSFANDARIIQNVVMLFAVFLDNVVPDGLTTSWASLPVCFRALLTFLLRTVPYVSSNFDVPTLSQHTMSSIDKPIGILSNTAILEHFLEAAPNIISF